MGARPSKAAEPDDSDSGTDSENLEGRAYPHEASQASSSLPSEEVEPQSVRLADVSSTDAHTEAESLKGAIYSVRSVARSPVRPGNVLDLRLHSNQVNVGGYWGIVDLSTAVKLVHKTRSQIPSVPRLVPASDADRFLRDKSSMLNGESESNFPVGLAYPEPDRVYATGSSIV